MKSPIKFFLLIVLNIQAACNFGIDLISIPKINPDLAVSLVKTSTAILPQFDSIGHHVLHTNQVLINQLLDTNIDPLLKKKLILQVIQLTKQGDDMGGKILQDYYNFINYLL
jgi:hypothetical protein